MSRSPRFWLRPNSYSNTPETPQTICIWYKGINGEKRQCKTDYKVAPNHWNKKQNFVDQKYIEDYPFEVEALNQIRGKFPEQVTLINKGAPIQTIWENLTFKRDLSQTVQEFILASNFSQNTKRDYIYHLNGILKHTSLNEVKLSDILDVSRLELIRDELKSSKLGNGGARYLETCKAIAGKFTDDTDSIYRTIKLTKVEVERNPVSPKDFKMGINNIDTIGQLEAYLLWLYSFMLKGLTGIDIPNIDEDCLSFKSISKEINHYHIIGDFIQAKNNNSSTSKVHWRSIRSKRGVRINGLYNLFPILFVRDWLHYCINLSHPQFAYKGEDRIKVFNFYTKDKKNNDIPKGVDKWNTLRDTYYDQYKKILEGKGSLHNTRHTFTHIMERLGLSDSEQKKAIGHKRSSKDSIESYKSKLPIEVKEDLNQMEVFRKFDVIGCVELLLKRFAHKKITDNKGRLYFDISKISVSEFQVYAKLDGDYQDSAHWAIDDEIRYQKLLDEYEYKGKVEFNPETGLMEEVKNTSDSYEGQLGVLHNRRHEFLEKIPYRLDGKNIIVDVSDKKKPVSYGSGTEKLKEEHKKQIEEQLKEN